LKLVPGKSEPQKTRLASEIAKDVMDILQCAEQVVSTTFGEVKSEDWAEKVYGAAGRDPCLILENQKK
jgi:4-oxalocrotonate tautomerase